jgi:hypothetical protein
MPGRSSLPASATRARRCRNRRSNGGRRPRARAASTHPPRRPQPPATTHIPPAGAPGGGRTRVPIGDRRPRRHRAASRPVHRPRVGRREPHSRPLRTPAGSPPAAPGRTTPARPAAGPDRRSCRLSASPAGPRTAVHPARRTRTGMPRRRHAARHTGPRTSRFATVPGGAAPADSPRRRPVTGSRRRGSPHPAAPLAGSPGAANPVRAAPATTSRRPVRQRATRRLLGGVRPHRAIPGRRTVLHRACHTGRRPRRRPVRRQPGTRSSTFRPPRYRSWPPARTHLRADSPRRRHTHRRRRRSGRPPNRPTLVATPGTRRPTT